VRSVLTHLLGVIHVLLQLIKLSPQSVNKELMSKWGNVVFGGSEICKFSAARTFCIVNKSLNLGRRNLNNELGKSALQVM
jgi:predicted membrane channel-forming protein YqfA (hemolysin III family)